MPARLRFAVLAAVLLIGAVYLGDYAALRFRIAKQREPFGTVQVKAYYAVRLKNRKTEIMPADPQDEVCVHSLFPHFGRNPCWYVERHREKRIDVSGLKRPWVRTPHLHCEKTRIDSRGALLYD